MNKIIEINRVYLFWSLLLCFGLGFLSNTLIEYKINCPISSTSDTISTVDLANICEQNKAEKLTLKCSEVKALSQALVNTEIKFNLNYTPKQPTKLWIYYNGTENATR